MKNEIKLVQSPVITHKLQEAGKQVSKRIADLELDKQVATEDSIKPLKSLRAELNSEKADFETQKKFVKDAVNNPYNEFEAIFKTEITDKYKVADDLLKDTISAYESKIKQAKKLSVETYFNELCQSEKIDFITFDKLGIDINLSITEKKYKEQVNDYIMKVVDDLALIKSTDYDAETLTEYKKTLNVSNAITTVKTRKENEAIETARIKAEQTQNRKNYLIKLGLNYVEITNSYEFNDDIFVSLSDVESLSKEDFTKKYTEIEAKIKDLQSKEVEVVESPIETRSDIGINPSTGRGRVVVSSPISAPLEATVVEEIKVASFEVKATYSKLKLLGQFMKDNGIEYKNI